MHRTKMFSPLPILLLVMACAKTDPVDEDAVAPPANLGTAMVANAAIVDAAAQGSLTPADGGLSWTYDEVDGTATFGPAEAPALSIQCQKPKEGEAQLIFVRHIPPESGTQATLSFTGNGKAASVPVSPITNPDGLGGHWRAAVPPSDNARDVAEAFAGQGTVEVSVSGTPPLVVSSSAEPRRVFGDCLPG